MNILLTGATGFVGGRLYQPLVDAGHRVRCGTRDVARARQKHSDRTWVALDLKSAATVATALEGVDAAYYLVHELTGAKENYGQRELAEAEGFARAAEKAGCKRIVYLGGFEPHPEAMSKHLESRLAVGRALRAGAVPCIELRASVIIGHGSASFQIIRDLAARLPAMVLPAWLDNHTQPAAIDDVVSALVAALTLPPEKSDWFDLPGPEIMSARQMLLRTAAILGVKPRTMPVPFLTPRLSARWLWLISGVDYRLAQELVDGLARDILAQKPLREVTTLPEPVPFDEAVRRALAEEEPRLRDLPARSWERLVRTISPAD